MTSFRNWFRGALFATLALILAACAGGAVQQEVPPPIKPIGDFKLGILVVNADNVEKGPMSRTATPDELKTAMQTELQRRFGVLDGSKFFNMAVSINAYALARTGIPLLLTPKSALVVTLNVWDDAKKKIITEEDKRFTVIEKLSAKSLIGSGLSMTKEQQLHEMVMLTVDKIEAYLRENEALFVNK